ncbi:MAG: hypothetical protein NC417_02110 [Candidatus Gastranaerophilales bacterium]|nr:hypothetical protein [Candidatus Gastranaerophilales bacterium]
MKFPFLASFILFIIVSLRANRRSRKNQEKTERNFWNRENEANSVRRKSLDDLDYIHIPLDRLPTHLMADDPKVAEDLRILKDLSTRKIVNFTGYTNTDLKLKYGAANITLLSEYDQNYTMLARTLQNWADLLWEGGYVREAVDILEFALHTHTDVSHTYYRLAKYYSSKGENFRIDELISQAKELRSANKNAIVHTLQESYQ